VDLLNETIKICRTNNIKPARSRGQNFLINEKIYNNIINAADLKKEDIVLEVGPGLGFLTEKLALKVKKVIAIELDKNLADILKVRLKNKGIGNVEIINTDVLKFNIACPPVPDFGRREYLKFKIVANIPYNITSFFLRKFLSENSIKPELMILMIQKEVAERIIARPPKMSLLSLSVQFYSKPEILEIVLKNNFWPQPEVDSAIIKLTLLNNPLLAEFNRASFFRILKFGFSAKRKMLKNNLAGGLHITHGDAENIIKNAGLNEKVRAQELNLDNWIRIFEIIEGNVV